MHFVELKFFKIEMKSVVYIYIIVGTWRNVNNVKEKSINARIPFNAKFHHIIFFNLLCAGGKCLGMLRKIFWKFLIQSAKAQRNEIFKKRSALNHYKVKLNSEVIFSATCFLCSVARMREILFNSPLWQKFPSQRKLHLRRKNML